MFVPSCLVGRRCAAFRLTLGRFSFQTEFSCTCPLDGHASEWFWMRLVVLSWPCYSLIVSLLLVCLCVGFPVVRDILFLGSDARLQCRTLGLCVVVSVAETTAPTSTLSNAPTVISTTALTMAPACAEGANSTFRPNLRNQ